MKLLYQHDERDCGAACLAMISTWHGRKMRLPEARRLSQTDAQGTNLKGLITGAEQAGLHAEALSGTMEELLQGVASGEVTLPFIAHVVSDQKFLHFVVVYGLSRGKVKIADPGKGRLKMTLEEFAAIWTGYIVTFRKAPDFSKHQPNTSPMKKYIPLMKGQYRRIVLALLLSLLVSVVGIIGALSFEVVIDSFYMANTQEDMVEEAHQHEEEAADTHELAEADLASMSELDRLIMGNPVLRALDKGLGALLDTTASSSFHIVFLALIVLYIVQSLIQIVRSKLIIDVSKNVDERMMGLFFHRVIDLPLLESSKWQTGEYLSRLSDADTIRSAISTTIISLAMDTMMVFACGYILHRLSHPMFTVSLIMVILYALLVLCYRKPIERSTREVMHQNALVESYFKETIDGAETIKATNTARSVKKAASEKIGALIQRVQSNSILGMTQETFVTVVEQVGTVIILWMGFSFVQAESMTIGNVITYYALLAYFSNPLKSLIELQPMLQSAAVAADRLNDVLDIEPEEDGQPSAGELTAVEEWRLKDIYFRYGSHEPVLNGVSLSVRKGEKIGIVGESGSGKTTLVKLFLRFFDPESGEILADGHPLRGYSLENLRHQVAYVSQNTFLFTDTIRNNLTLGLDSVSPDELEHVCSLCCLDSFLKDLPLGLDTPLEENGFNLSGGQRQRIAIARALLKKPSLLILDEATSNLDAVTENAIRKAIDNLPRDMACIIIAHRLSTIKTCNRLVVMKNGLILEEGSHEELLKKDGIYKELWLHQ